MTKYLSTMFREVREKTIEFYHNTRWDHGKVLRRKVGMPHLIAEDIAIEASALLDGINLSIHRNEPELREMLLNAREAADLYYRTLTQANWKKAEE